MRKRTPFIKVVWADHHESDAAWDTAGAEPASALFESRGWLIYEDDNILELSNSKPLNDAGGKDLWGRPLRLIKSAIVSRSDNKGKADAKEKPKAI